MAKSADFIPDDTVCPCFSLQRLIDVVKEKYGDEVDLSKVEVEISEEQYKCFGYDLYDSEDYRIEINFSLRND